eukprot:Rmarinus@m.16757
MSSGALGELVGKLRHELPDIRFRAFKNLHSKVANGFLSPGQLLSQPNFVTNLLEWLSVFGSQHGSESVLVYVLGIIQHVVMEEDCCQRLVAAGALHLLSASYDTPMFSAFKKDVQGIIETMLACPTPSAISEVPRYEPKPDIPSATLDDDRLLAEIMERQRGILAVHFQSMSRVDRPYSPEQRRWLFPRIFLEEADVEAILGIALQVEHAFRAADSETNLVDALLYAKSVLLENFPAEVFIQRPSLLEAVLRVARGPSPPLAEQESLEFLDKLGAKLQQRILLHSDPNAMRFEARDTEAAFWHDPPSPASLGRGTGISENIEGDDVPIQAGGVSCLIVGHCICHTVLLGANSPRRARTSMSVLRTWLPMLSGLGALYLKPYRALSPLVESIVGNLQNDGHVSDSSPLDLTTRAFVRAALADLLVEVLEMFPLDGAMDDDTCKVQFQEATDVLQSFCYNEFYHYCRPHFRQRALNLISCLDLGAERSFRASEDAMLRLKSLDELCSVWRRRSSNEWGTLPPQRVFCVIRDASPVLKFRFTSSATLDVCADTKSVVGLWFEATVTAARWHELTYREALDRGDCDHSQARTTQLFRDAAVCLLLLIGGSHADGETNCSLEARKRSEDSRRRVHECVGENLNQLAPDVQSAVVTNVFLQGDVLYELLCHSMSNRAVAPAAAAILRKCAVCTPTAILVQHLQPLFLHVMASYDRGSGLEPDASCGEESDDETLKRFPSLKGLCDILRESSTDSERIWIESACLLHIESSLRVSAAKRLQALLPEDALTSIDRAREQSEHGAQPKWASDPFNFSDSSGSDMSSTEVTMLLRATNPLVRLSNFKADAVSNLCAIYSAVNSTLGMRVEACHQLIRLSLSPAFVKLILEVEIDVVDFSLGFTHGVHSMDRRNTSQVEGDPHGDRHVEMADRARLAEAALVLLENIMKGTIFGLNRIRADPKTIPYLLPCVFHSRTSVRARAASVIARALFVKENTRATESRRADFVSVEDNQIARHLQEQAVLQAAPSNAQAGERDSPGKGCEYTHCVAGVTSNAGLNHRGAGALDENAQCQIPLVPIQLRSFYEIIPDVHYVRCDSGFMDPVLMVSILPGTCDSVTKRIVTDAAAEGMAVTHSSGLCGTNNQRARPAPGDTVCHCSGCVLCTRLRHGGHRWIQQTDFIRLCRPFDSERAEPKESGEGSDGSFSEPDRSTLELTRKDAARLYGIYFGAGKNRKETGLVAAGFREGLRLVEKLHADLVVPLLLEKMSTARDHSTFLSHSNTLATISRTDPFCRVATLRIIGSDASHDSSLSSYSPHEIELLHGAIGRILHTVPGTEDDWAVLTAVLQLIGTLLSHPECEKNDESVTASCSQKGAWEIRKVVLGSVRRCLLSVLDRRNDVPGETEPRWLREARYEALRCFAEVLTDENARAYACRHVVFDTGLVDVLCWQYVSLESQRRFCYPLNADDRKQPGRFSQALAVVRYCAATVFSSIHPKSLSDHICMQACIRLIQGCLASLPEESSLSSRKQSFEECHVVATSSMVLQRALSVLAAKAAVTPPNYAETNEVSGAATDYPFSLPPDITNDVLQRCLALATFRSSEIRESAVKSLCAVDVLLPFSPLSAHDATADDKSSRRPPFRAILAKFLRGVLNDTTESYGVRSAACLLFSYRYASACAIATECVTSGQEPDSAVLRGVSNISPDLAKPPSATEASVNASASLVSMIEGEETIEWGTFLEEERATPAFIAAIGGGLIARMQLLTLLGPKMEAAEPLYASESTVRGLWSWLDPQHYAHARLISIEFAVASPLLDGKLASPAVLRGWESCVLMCTTIMLKCIHAASTLDPVLSAALLRTTVAAHDSDQMSLESDQWGRQSTHVVDIILKLLMAGNQKPDVPPGTAIGLSFGHHREWSEVVIAALLALSRLLTVSGSQPTVRASLSRKMNSREAEDEIVLDGILVCIARVLSPNFDKPARLVACHTLSRILASLVDSDGDAKQRCVLRKRFARHLPASLLPSDVFSSASKNDTNTKNSRRCWGVLLCELLLDMAVEQFENSSSEETSGSPINGRYVITETLSCLFVVSPESQQAAGRLHLASYLGRHIRQSYELTALLAAQSSVTTLRPCLPHPRVGGSHPNEDAHATSDAASAVGPADQPNSSVRSRGRGRSGGGRGVGRGSVSGGAGQGIRLGGLGDNDRPQHKGHNAKPHRRVEKLPSAARADDGEGASLSIDILTHKLLLLLKIGTNYMYSSDEAKRCVAGDPLFIPFTRKLMTWAASERRAELVGWCLRVMCTMTSFSSVGKIAMLRLPAHIDMTSSRGGPRRDSPSQIQLHGENAPRATTSVSTQYSTNTGRFVGGDSGGGRQEQTLRTGNPRARVGGVGAASAIEVFEEEFESNARLPVEMRVRQQQERDATLVASGLEGGINTPLHSVVKIVTDITSVPMEIFELATCVVQNCLLDEACANACVRWGLVAQLSQVVFACLNKPPPLHQSTPLHRRIATHGELILSCTLDLLANFSFSPVGRSAILKTPKLTRALLEVTEAAAARLSDPCNTKVGDAHAVPVSILRTVREKVSGTLPQAWCAGPQSLSSSVYESALLTLRNLSFAKEAKQYFLARKAMPAALLAPIARLVLHLDPVERLARSQRGLTPSSTLHSNHIHTRISSPHRREATPSCGEDIFVDGVMEDVGHELVSSRGSIRSGEFCIGIGKRQKTKKEAALSPIVVMYTVSCLWALLFDDQRVKSLYKECKVPELLDPLADLLQDPRAAESCHQALSRNVDLEGIACTRSHIVSLPIEYKGLSSDEETSQCSAGLEITRVAVKTVMELMKI